MLANINYWPTWAITIIFSLSIKICWTDEKHEPGSLSKSVGAGWQGIEIRT